MNIIQTAKNKTMVSLGEEKYSRLFGEILRYINIYYGYEGIGDPGYFFLMQKKYPITLTSFSTLGKSQESVIKVAVHTEFIDCIHHGIQKAKEKLIITENKKIIYKLISA